MITVTGASGHIGGNLVRSLLVGGEEVRAFIHRDRRALDGLDVEIIEGDISDITSVVRACRGAEIVYHLAACISLSMVDGPRLRTVNVDGTRNVVEACLQNRVKRLVHFSSVHALLDKPVAMISEDSPLVTSTEAPPYNRSKADGEREILLGVARGLDAVIVNPTAVIGPYDYKPSHFGEVLLRLGQSRLPALVTGGFDWVDVRDVVTGAIRAAATGATGGRYLLSGHQASVRELARLVAEITGVPAPRFTCPAWLACLGLPVINRSLGNDGRPLYTSFSIKTLRGKMDVSREKAVRELDYQRRPLRQTLEDTISWFEGEGYLERLGCE